MKKQERIWSNFLGGTQIVGVNNGMGPGELRRLRWYYIDRPRGFIRFPADATKERHKKAIPINHNVKAVIDDQMRHLHHAYGCHGRDPIAGPRACEGALRGACERVGASIRTHGGQWDHHARLPPDGEN